MNELANPVKKSSSPEAGAAGMGGGGGGEEQFMDDDDDEEQDQGESGDEMDEEEEQDGGGGEFGGFGEPGPAPPPVYVEQPSDGFRTMEEEKSDIMFKLQRLHRQGVKGLRAFTPYSDIRDMRNELNRVRTELELDRSVKFQRKILMAIVSAMEWGNDKFNPFDLELEGWSEQMHQSVQTSSEYDGVFEELYFKYRGKVSTPPEIRLMLMVGGSAMMFHMTKAMMKSAMPGIGDLMRQNPAMMESLVKSFAGPGTQQAPEQAPQQQDGARREMRGPGIDLGGLAGGGGLGGLGGLFGGAGIPPPPVPPAGLQPAPTRPDRIKAMARSAQEFDDASDRLSDVISEDLQSLPDDLSAGGDSRDSSPAGRKNVRITVPSRGRATKRARKDASKTITI